MKSLTTLLLSLFSLFLLSGCYFFAHMELETLEYTNPEVKNKNLIVFMRGLGGSHHGFAETGMVDEVITRELPYDMIAPNAHFAYYAERTLIERLDKDIILPAVEQGYENIWLVGVSMGGLGSLLYYKERPEHVKGIVLISPFLGYEEITGEISKEKSLQDWQPGKYDADDDWERMFWHWLKDEVDGKETIPIYLGYGTEDEYAQGQSLFSTIIDEKMVVKMEGGHDIKTFTTLWKSFLDKKFYE